jgi:predicted nucleic acid-binding protein
VTLWVLDSSVVIKWFIPEADRPAALELRTSGAAFAAPDLLFVESANILWKLVKRGEIEPDRATAIIEEIAAASWNVHANQSLARDAIDLALASGASAYDASYVALAMRLNTSCITADRKLVEKLRGTAAANHVTLLAETIVH